jgi:hypothetical protein
MADFITLLSGAKRIEISIQRAGAWPPEHIPLPSEKEVCLDGLPPYPYPSYLFKWDVKIEGERYELDITIAERKGGD